jgi:hypothetical protein
LLAIGCEAVAKVVNAPAQESRADFIAGKVDRHPGRSYRRLITPQDNVKRRMRAPLLRGTAAAGYAYDLRARQQNIYGV